MPNDIKLGAVTYSFSRLDSLCDEGIKSEASTARAYHERPSLPAVSVQVETHRRYRGLRAVAVSAEPETAQAFGERVADKWFNSVPPEQGWTDEERQALVNIIIGELRVGGWHTGTPEGEGVDMAGATFT